jgi:murein DD-endopeptidase MepM/ murein hydrolase activator NlpD
VKFDWVKKIAVNGLLTLKVVGPAIFLAVPISAHAGIVSLMTSIFSAEASTNQETKANSQKMALLEAPTNTTVQVKEEKTKHVTMLDNSALVADAAVFGEGTDLAVTQKATEITTYKVQSGDTISDIAEKFGVSVNTILWANNLSRSSSIKVGQNLVILPISGVQHKVASGDTIQAIAKKYKGSVEEVMAYNNLDNETLKIGDIVVVPDGVLPASAVPAKPKTGVTARLASASTETSGYLIRPIAAGIKTQGIHGSNGVDLADSCGATVFASAAGTVTVAKGNGGWNGGYGNYVVISHSNGMQTLYAHMQSVSVSEGDVVNQGAVIGALGNTGKVYGATGCHVHYEVRGGRNPF